jgi:hypothetical protein
VERENYRERVLFVLVTATRLQDPALLTATVTMLNQESSGPHNLENA